MKQKAWYLILLSHTENTAEVLNKKQSELVKSSCDDRIVRDNMLRKMLNDFNFLSISYMFLFRGRGD